MGKQGEFYMDEFGEACQSGTFSLREELQPNRMKYAKEQLTKLGIKIDLETEATLTFTWKGNVIKHHAYTGWHSGKGIKDGRGIKNLINQLKQ